MRRRKGPKAGGSLRNTVGTCVCGILALWALAFCYIVLSTTSKPTVPVIEEWEANLNRYISIHESLQYHEGEVGRSTVQEGPYFHLGNLLSWNPDDTADKMWTHSPAHPTRGKGLPRFDYKNQSEVLMARAYELASLPFVFYNIPDLDEAANTAFTTSHLLANFGRTARIVERSNDNHFTYFHKYDGTNSRYPEWTPPQAEITMTLSEFMAYAFEAGKQNLINTANLRARKTPLHYLTISAGEGKSTPWITKALPFFDVANFKPSSSSHFSFIKDSETYHGINCRFGMRGVTSSAHFDSKDNFVAMVRGRKRYIVLPPSECDKLDLLPKDHPSGRHSKVDWSDPTIVAAHPTLKGARATEVVLKMGEMLFLPAFWFHYIVSQDASIQCNSRSGDTDAPGIISQCMQRVATRYRERGGDPLPSAETGASSFPAKADTRGTEGEDAATIQAAENLAHTTSMPGRNRRDGNTQTDAAALLNEMAHGQGLDLHPDHHFQQARPWQHSRATTGGVGGGGTGGPRTRRNDFGSEQRDLHMDSGADLRLDSIMKFGEE